MVKILLVHDGGKEASCVQSHLSDNLQIELWQVRSIAEGEEKYPAISPDIILAPLTGGEDYDLGRIVSWQRQCNVHGHHPGFLLFSMQFGLGQLAGVADLGARQPAVDQIELLFGLG
mgnify:CR=1 FL=1